jgi:ParB-like chromosome segregation protein Spo0J
MAHGYGAGVLAAVNADRCPSARVRLGLLAAAAYSPRRSGENAEHAKLLAESGSQLPPIIVHRRTMRVIDGMHRLRAAEMRGEEEIEVRFFDGDEASSFVLAVRSNVHHGLPLTLAERKAAAARIIELYPQWSDRMIASETGLSAKTVAAIRARPTAEDRQLDARIGRDGRIRPVDIAKRREIAARLIEYNPGASLREVARKAGVSPETVRGIRTRLCGPGRSSAVLPQDKGEAVSPLARRSAPPRGPDRDADGVGRDHALPLRMLRADPAFRSTESGRILLQALSMHTILEERGNQLAESVPAHCLPNLAEAVQTCIRGWQDLAGIIERRQRVLAG